jgi:hypothetical protein
MIEFVVQKSKINIKYTNWACLKTKHEPHVKNLRTPTSKEINCRLTYDNQIEVILTSLAFIKGLS